ncbi:MAG: molybdate ABC transporter substrate-binding protein [Syntrophomonadaceae bacterium]|nr:molybdate ABC transporter substrate-binding protein [Syntrophomonadaceae bacterium]
MKKKSMLLALVLMMALMLAACGGQEASVPEDVTPPVTESAEPVTLNISAAASLTNAGDEIAALYKEEAPHVTLVMNYAGSGALQKQIEEGAPADLFISAGQKQMNALADAGLIVADSRADLLRNELVLIAGEANTTLTDFEGLTDDSVQFLALGETETVPAGQYAQAALTHLGLWDALQPKIVPGKDVRAVLTYVETGNAEAGMVYKSDTVDSEGIRIVCSAPEGSHEPIVYPMAVIAASPAPEAAAAFAAYLQGPEAAAVLEKYGFTPIE